VAGLKREKIGIKNIASINGARLSYRRILTFVRA